MLEVKTLSRLPSKIKASFNNLVILRRKIHFQGQPVGETSLVIISDSQLERVGVYTLEGVAAPETEVFAIFK